MTIMGRLLEKRAIDASQFNRAAFLDEPTHAGVPVDQDSSLKYVAVYACVRLIAESIAMLPVDFRRLAPDGERVPVRDPDWYRAPNRETTWFEFIERVLASLLLDGNAFIGIADADGFGIPSELWVLPPRNIEVKRDRDATDVYFLYKGTERLRPFDGLGANPSRTGDVLHIKAFSAPGQLRGLSPIEAARQTIGLGIVAEKHGARFFGSGQQLSGVIQTAPGVKVTQNFLDNLSKGWMARHGGPDKSHLPGVIAGGEWKPLSISNEQAQFLETRKWQANEVAMLYRVPPHRINLVDRSTSWGTGLEEENQQFINISLMPWMVRLESAFNQFTPRQQIVKWNPAGLLRGDLKSRYEAYAIGKQWGFISTNEINELEDKPRVEGGDELWKPANMMPNSEDNSPPQEPRQEQVIDLHRRK